ADLAELRRAEITRVHSDRRRTFRAAIAFQRTDSEVIFKRQRNPLGKFLGPCHYILQTAKVFRRAAPQISLQKCWRCKKECNRVLNDQGPDGTRVQWAWMEDHANAHNSCQASRSSKTEGMEEGKNPKDLIIFPQH